MALNLTESTFEQEVLKSDIPVLVDFWAAWCGPCRILGPTIEELAEEYEGKVKICKLNVDGESSVAAKYGVMSIPTLIVFNKGKVVGQIVGALPKDKLAKWISSYLGQK